MQIILDRKVCQKFDKGIKKEWLETNNLGAYSASTIYGLNYHSYHGLYAIPVGSINERIIILSKFEESIFIGNQVYDLSTNKFIGGIHPQGYKYLKEFRLDPFPRFIFLIEKRRIEKIVFLLHDQNILVIRYTNKNQGVPVKLIVKPIIAGRKTTELTKEIPDIITDSYSDGRVVRIAPKPEIPELNIYHSKGDYYQAPLWYHNFEYGSGKDKKGKKEKPSSEDQFNPGFFTCNLNAYETLDLYVSVNTVTNFDYEAIFRREKEYRRKIGSKFKMFPGFAQDIYESLKTFRISRVEKYPLLLQNYHRYSLTTREMLLTLPGLSMAERNINTIKRVVDYFKKNLHEGLFPEKYPFDESEIPDHVADNSLHFINFAYHFIESTNDDDYLEQVLFNICKSIIDTFNKGTKYDIFKDKDDLLSTGNKQVSTSWIPIRDAAGNVIRYGKLLEMNALWYNSLKIMEYFSQILNKNRTAKRYAKMADGTRASFLEYFYNKSQDRFYDLIRHDWQDTSFRLNQVLLIALPFSMLRKEQGTKVLQQIEDELLTPFGLRTLSSKDKQFKGRLSGAVYADDPAYYLGCVWPWTIGMYVDSVFRIMGRNPTIIRYINKLLQNYEKLYYEDGMGYISEIYEGVHPHRKNGALAYGINLSELFRVFITLKLKRHLEQH